MSSLLPEFNDVRAAAARLKDQAVRTPLLTNSILDERVGGRILLKAECLQRTGTFKFRGAFNALSKLSESEARKGVVAFSSGNHAQGVAEAARILGIKAIIVMPEDAPEVKKAGVLARGAEIRAYDRATESREEIAQALCETSGAALIPSYDHPDVIAGQGTCGLEIFETLETQGVHADQLVCCVGGGGLLAGINLAAQALSPETAIYGAEPEEFDDHARSLASGEKVENVRKAGSLCDALLTATPGELTYAINQPRLSGVGVVSDLEALQAVRFGFETLKLVLEPGGAAALASVLSGKIDARGKTTVVVLTGGNVDSAVFQQALSS